MAAYSPDYGFLMYLCLKSLFGYLLGIPCSFRFSSKLYVLKDKLNFIGMTSSLTKKKKKKEVLKMHDLNMLCFLKSIIYFT